MYETLELIPYPEQSLPEHRIPSHFNLQARERSGLALKGAGLASGPAAAEHPTAFSGRPRRSIAGILPPKFSIPSQRSSDRFYLHAASTSQAATTTYLPR